MCSHCASKHVVSVFHYNLDNLHNTLTICSLADCQVRFPPYVMSAAGTAVAVAPPDALPCVWPHSVPDDRVSVCLCVCVCALVCLL